MTADESAELIDRHVLEANIHKLRTVGKLRAGCSVFAKVDLTLDRVFVATMYTSDVDKIMRYTDEVRAGYSETKKSSGMTDRSRCFSRVKRWNSVDGRWTLVHCPRFKKTRTCPRMTDFIRVRLERKCFLYLVVHMTSADFELGLELDGAEVRGILVYEGQEWGRVVFDMLS